MELCRHHDHGLLLVAPGHLHGQPQQGLDRAIGFI
jgi:hypothetical protein